MSVNVSTKQLREPGFPAVVAGILDDTGVHPSAIVLEITESLLVEDRPAMIAQLERLRALGVRLAVDDFGTGYSVLSHLQQFPLDLLKIDKSFVDGIAEDRAKADLLCGIITLGASLHLTVVVEGIEHAAQARRLRDVPGLLAQGFLFSRPVGADAMGDRLAASATDPA
jgi:EAL domain-containing protein (putative c-di-GMP-specific phosphodiesterase class I)